MEQDRKTGFRLGRRAFLGIAAAAGAGAALGAGISPAASGLIKQAQASEPLDEQWIATSCLNCPTWCGVKVRVVNGRAVKVIGNPLSQTTEGAVCAKANLMLQKLYDPDRIKTPMKRTNPKKGLDEDPGWVPITYEAAIAEVAAKLKETRARGAEKLAIFRGRYTEADAQLVSSRFASAYGTRNVFTHSALCAEGDKIGQWLANGTFGYNGYDLERSKYLLVFGLSPLEGHRPTARLQRMWGKMKGQKDATKMVVIDPRYSVSAAKADEWLPVNPGEDGALALGIAHVILTEGLWDRAFVGDFTQPGRSFVAGKAVAEEEFVEVQTFGLIKWWNLVLKDFTPEKAAEISGIDALKIRRIAREFATTKPAIAWRARGACSWNNGAYNSFAIFALNALAGSWDVPGGITGSNSVPYKSVPAVTEDDAAKAGRTKPAVDLRGTKRFPQASVVTNNAADAIISGEPYQIEMGLGWHCNFNFSAPGAPRWGEALKKIYFVHITPFISEMTLFADIILPSATPLEKWGYDHGPDGAGFGEVRIKQPVVEPLFGTKATADIVFDIAREMGGSVAKSFEDVGGSTEAFTRMRTQDLLPWEEFRAKGVWTGPAYKYSQASRLKTPSTKFEFYSQNLKNRLSSLKMTEPEYQSLGFKASGDLAFVPHYEAPRFLGDKKDFPLTLITYKPHLNSEGRSMNNPWAQEIYLVMYKAGWTNFAEINPITAAQYGIKQGDLVTVESQFGQIKLPAMLFEGIHPGVVAIAFGQGHKVYGRWAKDKGANPNDITGVDYEPLSGMSAYFNTRVRIAPAGGV